MSSYLTILVNTNVFCVAQGNKRIVLEGMLNICGLNMPRPLKDMESHAH